MAVRYPRCYLAINGENIPCKKVEVTLRSAGNASEFSADISATRAAMYGMNLKDWADFQPTDVSILLSLAPGEADQIPIITGKIDTPHIDWKQMTIAVSGRDKSATLFEARRSQKFSSQSSSEIVSTIARDNGLNPVVVSTPGMAGKQYNESDVNHLAIHRSDAEILADLCDREAYRWYVKGSDLYFEPKDQQSDVFRAYWSPPGIDAPYGIANITDLETFRNMTAAKPHQMNVKSWHHKDRQQHNGSAKADGVGDQISIDHHHNGKTQDQTDSLATSRLRDAIRHDCNVVIKAPADLSVSANMQMQLSGTGTIYDQLYDIDSVALDFSWDGGAEMSIECKAPKSGRSVTSGGGVANGADSAPGD